MIIYKLSAETDLEMKEFIVSLVESETYEWNQYMSNIDIGIHNCVYLGQITEQDGEYDINGEEITPPVLSQRYHADILCEKDINIPQHIMPHNPENPVHKFL